MKTWITMGLAGCLICGRLIAEGTLNFANGAAGVNAPVTDADGSRLSGPEWSATLLHLPEDGEPVPVAGPVALGEGDLAGYFLGGTVVLKEASPRSMATFQVRFSNAGGTRTALSDPVTIELGGDLYPPANLVGLSSIQVPGVISSALELQVNRSAQQVELVWSEGHSDVRLESTESLASPQWTPVQTAPSVDGAVRVLNLSASEQQRFYRLKKVTE